jgi:hypothetical protein
MTPAEHDKRQAESDAGMEQARKAEAFDVIERERLTVLAASQFEPIPRWIVANMFTNPDSAPGETLLSAVDAWLRMAKGGTP